MMKTIEELARYCKEHRGAKEDYPFGPEPLVMKVDNKMFALISGTGGVTSISLKCEPHMAELLRLEHVAVKPGYHLNKKHWNTVTVDGSVPDAELQAMIDHSYELVVGTLTKAQRARLAELEGEVKAEAELRETGK
ncbi:MmcQ/YjbR family DNA-binding protein [Paenibacillus soyae]|uniref:MmcQ/YjbR family DNA-binding protein n=1 Tax=Paenibacillus soyae TaxID=2969249 RepID=A0A9X2MWK0_9BACL|nr:MmcQ/YjbR family DNA-binding protein [Paenibacillus soyae]MCR2807644.1 MmcQ/YjbR family DNA-binding protein [Paenibacillus soyae]